MKTGNLLLNRAKRLRIIIIQRFMGLSSRLSPLCHSLSAIKRFTATNSRKIWVIGVYRHLQCEIVLELISIKYAYAQRSTVSATYNYYGKVSSTRSPSWAPGSTCTWEQVTHYWYYTMSYNYTKIEEYSLHNTILQLKAMIIRHLVTMFPHTYVHSVSLLA